MNSPCILLFGGTSEGRELVFWEEMQHFTCHVYVATQAGASCLKGARAQIHVGRLKAEEMEGELRKFRPLCVLDATHPYATEVTANLRMACGRTETAYYRILRAKEEMAGDREAADAREAAELLKSYYRNLPILLTTGTKELTAFREVIAVCGEVYVRILPGEDNRRLAEAAGIKTDHILTGEGPFSVEENERVIRTYGIRCLVTKESGARGGYPEKLQAAKATGCEVLVIRRPMEEEGITMEDVPALLRSIRSG